MDENSKCRVRLILPSGVMEFDGTPEECADKILRHSREESRLGSSWAEIIPFPRERAKANHPSAGGVQ